MEALKEILENARASKGLTIRDVCKAVNISAPTLYRIYKTGDLSSLQLVKFGSLYGSEVFLSLLDQITSEFNTGLKDPVKCSLASQIPAKFAALAAEFEAKERKYQAKIIDLQDRLLNFSQ